MAKEPEWLTRLAQAGSAASRNQERRTGKTGPASEGRRITSWVCKCGWMGSSQDLKAGPSGISCPACGSAPDKA
jgi:hypothetical protein